MLKNNLKSLLIHATISIISIIVFMIFFTAQPKWASEEAARNHHYSMMFLSIIIIVVAAISYYILGRKRLICGASTYRNLFSVSLTAILGVSLWMIAFNIDRIGPSNRLLNSQLWQYYISYNGYSILFLDESGNNNPYVFLLFSFIPTIAMWTGLQKKTTLHSLKE